MTPKPRHAATAARPVAPPQPNPASIAAGWLHAARFLTTAPELHFLPALEMPEIAFVGRSNAGKSTCINTLTQQKQLAFASRKPGRTQHINLFTRENLSGIVLLCDPRRGLTDLDEILLDVIRPRVEQGLKFLLLLTKADKLTKVDATKALSIAKLQAGGGQAMLFSATKRQGFDDVARLLWQWAHPADGQVTPKSTLASDAGAGTVAPAQPDALG